MIKKIVQVVIASCIGVMITGGSISAASSSSDRLTAEAKLLVDEYYGDGARLVEAADLLRQAYLQNPRNADLFVQAARVTVKGGHVVASQYRPGTMESYSELVEQAIALDPKNQKAHILRAEVFSSKKDFASELKSLDLAKSLGTSDRWLFNGYARHFRNVDDEPKAISFYQQVKSLGPGVSSEQRNAYSDAVEWLAIYAAWYGDRKSLVELAATVRKNMHPRDAWALGNLSPHFMRVAMYDEAIAYNRQALAIMDYGAGRLTLSRALYGKAAQLIGQGKTESANSFIQEAKNLGFGREDILPGFGSRMRDIETLYPILLQIVK